MKYLLPILVLAIANLADAAEKPLSLHPDNPHYFLFRGNPTILITSAEHYGAVLNRDFDYHQISRRTRSARPEPNPHLYRRLLRRHQILRHHAQHTGTGGGKVDLPVGAVGHARLCRRRQPV